MTKRTRPGSQQRAVGYLRQSTDGQRLDEQRDAISTWATAKGIAVVAWFDDLGISGDAPVAERPGLQSAIRALRPERAGILVSSKRDRISRDPLTTMLIERAARDEGAVLATVESTSTGNTRQDVFMRRILDASAEFELATIRDRTRAALAAKKSRGERTGGLPPYGWRTVGPRVPHPTIPGRFLPQRLEPNPDEAEVIATARQLRDQHGWSLRDITRELTELGKVSRVGKPFRLTQVARMLATPAADAHQAAPLSADGP